MYILSFKQKESNFKTKQLFTQKEQVTLPSHSQHTVDNEFCIFKTLNENSYQYSIASTLSENKNILIN